VDNFSYLRWTFFSSIFSFLGGPFFSRRFFLVDHFSVDHFSMDVFFVDVISVDVFFLYSTRRVTSGRQNTSLILVDH